MNSCQKGAVGELLACSYFIEQGYEVFRNVVPSGPADLVLWNPETNETIFVDVKSAIRYVKADGTVRYAYSKSKELTDVRVLLIYDNSIIGFADDLIEN